MQARMGQAWGLALGGRAAERPEGALPDGSLTAADGAREQCVSKPAAPILMLEAHAYSSVVTEGGVMQTGLKYLRD